MSSETWQVLVQLNATSLVDEGSSAVFDAIQQKASPTGVMLVAHGFNPEVIDRGRTWPGRGPKGSTGSYGGYFGIVNPRYYAGTALGSPRVRDPMFEGFDAIAVAGREAAARKLQFHLYILESAGTGGFQRHVAGWPSILEIDVDGRRGSLPCVNHPEYRRWKLALLEDLYSSYSFEGLLWGVERWGPIHQVFAGSSPACFCPHCRSIAVDAGLDWKRVIEGFAGLRDAAQGSGGGMATIRALISNPEILAWEAEWTRSYLQFHRELYGAVKWLEPNRTFGLGLWHYYFINPLLQAEWNMAEFAASSDYIRPILYHLAEGPRIKRYLGTLTKSFGGVKEETLWALLTELLGLELPRLDAFAGDGLPADYVAQGIETVRRNAGPDTPILAGLGVDVFEHGLDRSTTPDDVEAAIRSAYRAEIKGITISRNYAEMQHANLEAVGRTLKGLRNNRGR